MERLLKDAEKLSGVKYDISSLSDVFNAIHVVQTEMGITGTTAKEASETIEGSFNSAKSAVDNLLTGFGRSDADIDKLVGDVSDAVGDLAKNALPVAEKAVVTVTKTAIANAKDVANAVIDTVGTAVTDTHKMIAEEFGESADTLYAIEAAAKAAAAGFVVFKAGSKVAGVVDGFMQVNKELQKGVTLTEAMNNAKLANPYVLLATAAVGAATAIKSVIDTQTDLIDEAELTYSDLTDEQQEFIKSNDDLAGTISDRVKAAQDSIDSVNAEAGAIEKMRDELYKLDDAENLSNEQKMKMRQLVDQLNDSIPDLNLKLDEQTGHLKNQRGVVDGLVEGYKKQAKAQAAQEQLTELYKEQFEAEKNLEEATRKREGAYNKLSDLQLQKASLEKQISELTTAGTNAEIDRQEGLKQDLEAVNEAIKAQENALGDLNGAYVTANESLTSANNSIDALSVLAGEATTAEKNFGDTVNSVSKTAKDRYEEHAKAARDTATQYKDFVMTIGGETFNISQETYDKIQGIKQAYQDAVDSQEQNIRSSMDVFSEFNGGAEITADELQQNLDDNKHGLEEWAKNLRTLAEWGVDEGLLKTLQEAGPESANKVKAMVDMGKEPMKEYSAEWRALQRETHEIAIDQSEGMLKESQDMMADLIGVPKNERARSDMNSAYNELATYAIDGYVKGIEDGTIRVEKVTADMVHKGIAAGEEAQDSHSPSKVYRRLGGYGADGYALGIADGTQDVISAAEDMVLKAVGAADEAETFSAVGHDTFSAYKPDGIKVLNPYVPDGASTFSEYKSGGTSYFGEYTPTETFSPKAESSNGFRSYESSRTVPQTAVFNIIIDGKDFARAVAPYIDIENGATLYMQSRGLAT